MPAHGTRIPVPGPSPATQRQLRSRHTARLCALALALAVAGCKPSTPTDPETDASQLVLDYFTALSTHDTTAAYTLAHTGKPWLGNHGLDIGYQPPGTPTITGSASSAAKATVTVRYTLAGAWYQSTFSLQRPQSGRWTITDGATGTLAIDAPTALQVMVANVALAPPQLQDTNSPVQVQLPPGTYTIVFTDAHGRGFPAQASVPAEPGRTRPVTVTFR